jgi:hypothetical protein
MDLSSSAFHGKLRKEEKEKKRRSLSDLGDFLPDMA